MTIWEKYCKDNNDDCEEHIGLETYVGLKVRHVNYGPTGDRWSDSVHTIEDFDDDVCGDGCCNGYTISGSSLSWRSDQLQVVESE